MIGVIDRKHLPDRVVVNFVLMFVDIKKNDESWDAFDDRYHWHHRRISRDHEECVTHFYRVSRAQVIGSFGSHENN